MKTVVTYLRQDEEGFNPKYAFENLGHVLRQYKVRDVFPDITAYGVPYHYGVEGLSELGNETEIKHDIFSMVDHVQQAQSVFDFLFHPILLSNPEDGPSYEVRQTLVNISYLECMFRRCESTGYDWPWDLGTISENDYLAYEISVLPRHQVFKIDYEKKTFIDPISYLLVPLPCGDFVVRSKYGTRIVRMNGAINTWTFIVQTDPDTGGVTQMLLLKNATDLDRGSKFEFLPTGEIKTRHLWSAYQGKGKKYQYRGGVAELEEYQCRPVRNDPDNRGRLIRKEGSQWESTLFKQTGEILGSKLHEVEEDHGIKSEFDTLIVYSYTQYERNISLITKTSVVRCNGDEIKNPLVHFANTGNEWVFEIGTKRKRVATFPIGDYA